MSTLRDRAPPRKTRSFQLSHRSARNRSHSFRIKSNLTDRAIVSRRPRSGSVVSDYTILWEQAAHGITPGYIQAKRAKKRAKGKGVPQKARIGQYRFATSRLVRQTQPTQTTIALAAVKSIYSADLKSTPQIYGAVPRKITGRLPRKTTGRLPRKFTGQKCTQNFSR